MGLFTKTVVVHGGLSASDMRALEEAFTAIGDAARERLQGIDLPMVAHLVSSISKH